MSSEGKPFSNLEVTSYSQDSAVQQSVTAQPLKQELTLPDNQVAPSQDGCCEYCEDSCTMCLCCCALTDCCSDL